MRIVWFRNDLRTADHEALSAAVQAGPCVGVFLWAETQWQAHDVGAPRLAFLRRTLAQLQRDLAALNIPLIIARADRFADAPRVMMRIASAVDASHIHASEEFPLNERIRDSKVGKACRDANVQFVLHDGGALMAPGSVVKDNGEPYSVFTPFKKRWAAQLGAAARTPIAIPAPAVAAPPVPQIHQVAVRTDECLDCEKPFEGIDAGLMASHWPGGEGEAGQRLRAFSRQRLGDYDEIRDLPAVDGTSALSPYLSIGAISARSCLAAALKTNGDRLFGGNPGASTWISELVWRDFYRHVVIHYPHVNKHRAFKEDTDALPWRHDKGELAAWQEGQTGYPLVDAAMRQLNDTGWMHNRLRMVAAMFLSKHLLMDWRLGERYFMERLVDGDFAANNGGWQWSASTGTDAAPYFRIFNPTSQAERYDADGAFVLAHVPELKPLATHLEGRRRKHFFEPWTAPQPAPDYPAPIVDHKFARERALAAFKSP
ncbi:MAG: deoxyribodipyrimidine photo-lyase [Pseudomonadota bacterium]